jgi:hypothetical protein
MDRSTVGATIPLETQRSRKIIKIPAHITMSPLPWAPAPRTPRRTESRILLAHLLQKLDINIAIQYQIVCLWWITEDSSPGRESPSVIPSAYFMIREK